MFCRHLLRQASSILPGTMLLIGVAGIVFGLSTRIFVYLTHKVELIQSTFVRYPPLRPMIGGFILIGLFYIEGTMRYTGLGISFIQEVFVSPASFKDPLFKTFFTSLTIGSGFKGGEFVPLVFIGATLGSALSIFLPLSVQLLAAVGFSASFAGAANTPLTCTIMAVEIFGYKIAPFAFVACYMSYLSSSHQGIYKSQKIVSRKNMGFTHFVDISTKRFGDLTKIKRLHKRGWICQQHCKELIQVYTRRLSLSLRRIIWIFTGHIYNYCLSFLFKNLLPHRN